MPNDSYECTLIADRIKIIDTNYRTENPGSLCPVKIIYSLCKNYVRSWKLREVLPADAHSSV